MQKSQELIEFQQKQIGICVTALLGIFAVVGGFLLWIGKDTELFDVFVFIFCIPAAVLWLSHFAAVLYFMVRGKMQEVPRWWTLLWCFLALVGMAYLFTVIHAIAGLGDFN